MNKHQLTENEILKFKNIALQKQLNESEISKLSIQEELVAQLVSKRVGEDVSRWHFDLKNGTVFDPNTEDKEDSKDEV